MKTKLLLFLLTLTIVGARGAESQVAPSAGATNAPPSSAPAKLSSEELEKLVMPIALHPDPLIAIILPASVYPLEIVQAARFVKDTNNIPKVDDQPWDDNVKELAKFPDMIAKMDADLPWTMRLGDAFLNQGKELMDTIQSLRGKAQKAGTLQSSAQQIVNVTNIVVYETNIVTHEVNTVTKEIVQVQPSNPQVVYVPSYPPTVYYPPPAYVYNPIAPLVTFGVGMAWGAVLANNCNWGGGDVDVDVNRNVNRNTNRSTDRNTQRSGNQQRSGTQQRSGGSQKWQPDKNRMSKSGTQSVQNKDARGWGGGGSGPSQRGSGAGAGNRSAQTASTRGAGASQGQRPSAGTQPSRSQGAAQGAGNRASPSASSANRSGGGQRSSSAFSGSSSGSSARSASSRGSSSRGGGGGGGRGGGGGGGGRR